MLKKGFMSEIADYERIVLGETEQHFLCLIAEGQKSAYDILLLLRSLASHFKSKTMAYKNVHNRIKRLQELQLIEQVEGNFKRKAIKYRLTSRGLFQCLLVDDRFFSWDILYHYKDDTILQTILYQYFEVETIKEFASSMSLQIISSVALLPGCLRKCCEAILKKLEEFRIRIKGFKERGWPVIKPEEVIEDVIGEMDDSIRHEIKDFIFQTVTFSKYEEQNEVDLDPNLMLSKDEKFIGLLQEIKKDFDDGCKNFGLQ